MKKIFYVNKKDGHKLEFISKEGQIYTLKNEQNEIITMYRISLSKNRYDMIEEEIEENVINNDDFENFKNEMFNNDIKLLNAPQKRHNKKHKTINVVDGEGVEHTFDTIKEFATYLEEKYEKRINKGHLYNLVNKKSKSYLGYKLVE